MKKIIIAGNGGTGKSTLGRQLGEILKIPVTHLDPLTFKTGWIRVPEDEFRKKLFSVLDGDKWIVEGWSYHSTIKARLEAADTIIYLDYPVWFCYWNALKRHIQYTFRQNPYDPPDSWIWKKTIRMVKAMWMVHKVYEPELREMLKDYEDSKNVYVFKKRGDLKKFIKSLGNS